MSSLNRVFLIGNLGQDPEMRYTQNQNAVCSMRIATSERRKNASTGEWTEQTEWHSIVAWGKVAEKCAQYLSKGSKILVEGKLQTRKWQDKEGKDRYTTEVVAANVTFMGGKGQAAGAATEGAVTAEAARNPAPLDSISFDDDEIPF
ncbi:single-stranded DNA-binding protein [bacterium]|nr:single-stranded DNA-binding protein [bacterium]